MTSVDFTRYYHLETYLFDEVATRFRSTGTLTAFDFFCIIVWKANRAKSKVAKRLLAAGHSSLDASVAHLVSQIVAADLPKARLAVLISGWGFRLPMASAILTVLYPEDFTVYDVRVCEELGDFADAQNRAKFDVQWERYAAFVERVREEVPEKTALRDKDRFLWGRSFGRQLRQDVVTQFSRGKPLA